MRKYNLFHLGMAGLLIIATLPSCENEEPEISPYAQIYMPQAINKPSQHTLVLMDSTQSLVFGAAYGSPDVLGMDMEVEFEVAPDKVTEFNQENGGNYEMMPEGTYELSGDLALINGGEMQSQSLKVLVNPSRGFDFETQYLLPVTIRSVQSKLPINEALRTTYFLVDANPPVYEAFDRSQWHIFDVSSEEVSGEGENNGHAIHALDGDIETFWHTQWLGASPGLPHIIAVDMGESKLLSGLSFIQRQNRDQGNVNEIFVEVSEDGENWEEEEVFPGRLMDNNNITHVYLKNPKDARYFRVTIASTYGDTNFTHLAEIYGF